jgi:hypothetical protein
MARSARTLIGKLTEWPLGFFISLGALGYFVLRKPQAALQGPVTLVPGKPYRFTALLASSAPAAAESFFGTSLSMLIQAAGGQNVLVESQGPGRWIAQFTRSVPAPITVDSGDRLFTQTGNDLEGLVLLDVRAA